jgi:hypothetical protein
MYYIVMLTPEKLEPLAMYETYSEADMDLEGYCNKYPQAWLEVVSKADLTTSNQGGDQ